MFDYNIYGDMETFMHDVGCERIWRFWIYRRMFTPYEQQEAFTDESVFEDVFCTFGIIREVIDLHGDYLLGIEKVCKDEGFKISEHPCLEYYKLSEIRLSYYPDDMNTDDDDMEKFRKKVRYE